MLHPILDLSNFNIVLTVISTYVLLFGFISLKVKQKWYLGDALPAFLVGVLLGPVGTRFLKVDQWGGIGGDKDSAIAYGLTRLVIGIQLVKVGYDLPKKYFRERFSELMLCLLPLTAIGWIATSACIILMIPHISFLSALIIGSCVACTDPILSQAIAKGPFADNYVRRPLREFISSEAGGNDGIGFPFLLLAVSLLRYAEAPENTVSLEEFDLVREVPDFLGTVRKGRFGGGAGRAMKHWVIEGVLYMVIIGSIFGAILGYLCRKTLNFASKKRWIDTECFSLVPVALGLFTVGTCGCIGSDETLACFIAGNAFNWDGQYHAETQARHDSFNSTLETLLNFGTFICLGAIMPWDQFHMPRVTGITVWRLIGLGFLILVFRRIPAIFIGYRFMPKVCKDWKEALFMGYFGPIGVGAISYVEYTRRLFPAPGKSDREINNLTASITPVVYWLVFFSIIVHGISVPILDVLYRRFNVPRVCDHPVEILLLSENEPIPNNSIVGPQRRSVIINNAFSRSPDSYDDMDAPRDGMEIMLRRCDDSLSDRDMEPSSTEGSPQKPHFSVDIRDIV